MKIHQRGVDLLLNLQDALGHVDKLSEADVGTLLKEAESVLRDLLARDVPVKDAGNNIDAVKGIPPTSA